MPGNEIQEQGVSIDSRFLEFRKALHVVCLQTERSEIMTVMTRYYASISCDAQANHWEKVVFVGCVP